MLEQLVVFTSALWLQKCKESTKREGETTGLGVAVSVSVAVGALGRVFNTVVLMKND